MSIIQGTAKGGVVAASFYDYPIEDSLRFDGSSYLTSSNTTTNGSSTTWTWSAWVKRNKLGAAQTLFEAFWLSNSYDRIGFLSGDTLYTIIYVGANAKSNVSSEVFRDTSAWYHIVWVWDTQNTDVNLRNIIYVNNNLLNKASGTAPALSSSADSMNKFGARPHVIGYHGYSSTEYSDLYLANIQFIYGQALDASYFGETKDDIWIPKTFDGTSSTGGSTVSTDYGTNGFLLDFSSISGTTINDTAPIDTNHSSANNWTATGF